MAEPSLEILREQLRLVGEDLQRIAEGLAGNDTAHKPDEGATPLCVDIQRDLEVDLDSLRFVLNARKLRSKFLPSDLFADPAWDMLLALLEAEAFHTEISVTSLCYASGIPATTALRWLQLLTDRQLVRRHRDKHDRRRVLVVLESTTSAALKGYLAALFGGKGTS